MACLPAGRSCRRIVQAIVLSALFPAFAAAQQSPVPTRITQPIDANNRMVLKGNVHPLARPEFDRGPAPSGLPLKRMLLVLQRSPDQEAALESLLDAQQDKTSPNYHGWLTPQQFGRQFGPADQDIQTIVSWLESQGFQVDGVANGRGVIEFSGTAGQVQNAFHAEIDEYAVNGAEHWANSTDPQIPVALAPVVAGVASLNSFRRQPMYRLVGVFSKSQKTGQVKPATTLGPSFTEPCGTNPSTGQPISCYGVGPYDFATTYNVLPLWTASPAVDGTGESIAIVARTNINLQDVSDFQALFSLPSNPPQVILDGPDPGIVSGDETEADLDVEWSGAVAKGAAIKLVVSQSTETSDGVDLSALYIVDNDLAPVMSESYGECELGLGSTGNQFLSNLWEQAAAEGITVFVSSGDNGSAGCDSFQGNVPEAAQYGLQVSGVASTAYNVAVGGTDFNDYSNGATYWNATNSSTTQASARGYIPETTWNNSCTNALFAQLGFSTNAETNCNNSQLVSFVDTLGGSGGKSACTLPTGPTCSGGYSKPSWQAGTGVPADARRDLPDVSLFASNGFVGNFYMMCERDATNGPCSTSSFLGVGGTSVASPAFAGLLALVDQKMGAPQGNANYTFYKLAAKTGYSCTSAPNPAGTCVFYDIPAGSTIAMPCLAATSNCSPASGHQFGVLPGYATTAGYDLATGLGSVNANNLVNDWNTVSNTPSTTTLILNGGNPVSITHGSPVSVSVAVAPNSPQPTGDVSLLALQGGNSTPFGKLTLSGGTVAATVNSLPGGTSYSVQAHYAGDANYQASDSNAVTVTVNPESSKTGLSIVAFNAAGQITNANATSVPYGSPYLLRSDVTNSGGAKCFNSGSKIATYPCPTGSVAITDNGAALGPGTFALNSQGYTEYQAVQLTGGSHTLAANYSGDTSYNASSGTDAVTVTPAPTTTSVTSPVSQTPPATFVIGTPFPISVQAGATSSGVAPTGTFKVFDGGTQLSLIATSTNGSTNPNTGQVYLSGQLQTTLSAPSGPHTLTVDYSGDANYASSASAAVTVNAVYPVTLAVTATPNAVVYGQNTTVTVTATLSTTNPAGNASLKPMGAVSFNSSFGGITGTVATTTGQDSSGNWTLTATITTTPQQSEIITANFAGDSNYMASSGTVFVTVTVPDFTISAGASPLVAAGQTATMTVTVTPTTNYTSTVALSCATSYTPGVVCTFSPSSVTLTNGAPATATVSIATLAPSSINTAMNVPPQVWHLPAPPSNPGLWLAASAAAGLLSIFLIVVPARRRFRLFGAGFAVVALLSFAIGCGGGSNASTGTSSGISGQTNPVPTTTTISVPSTKTPWNGSSVTLTATVGAATGTPTGAVSFPCTNCGFSGAVDGGAPLVNGTAQAQVYPLNPGTYTYSAEYGGNSNYESSQSGSLNIVFTGTVALYISGQTSTDMHGIQVNLALQ